MAQNETKRMMGRLKLARDTGNLAATIGKVIAGSLPGASAVDPDSVKETDLFQALLAISIVESALVHIARHKLGEEVAKTCYDDAQRFGMDAGKKMALMALDGEYIMPGERPN